MANWAVVSDGNIIELHDFLPDAWRNISGFNHLVNNPEKLLSLGWYPVNSVPVSFDDDVKFVANTSYVIEANNTVTQTPIIQDLPAQVKLTPLQLKQRFMHLLRARRNAILNTTDWTQTPDIVALRGIPWRDSWRTYRQQLRDLPQTYALPDPTIKIVNVVWPTPPAQA